MFDGRAVRDSLTAVAMVVGMALLLVLLLETCG